MYPTPRRMNFDGDIRESDIMERLLGPNLMGEYFVADHMTYDFDNDKTTVHLRFARQEDLGKKVWR